jgi:hypothetical protein
VVLADDEVLLRKGLANLLEWEGMDVIGRAGTAGDLSRPRTQARSCHRDVRMAEDRTDQDSSRRFRSSPNAHNPKGQCTYGDNRDEGAIRERGRP